MKYILTIFVLLSLYGLKAQVELLDYIPNRSTVKKARSETMAKMQEIRDSLNLTKKESKIRAFDLAINFERLEAIDQLEISTIKKEYFLKKESIYSYRLKTNPKGAGYLIDFTYDLKGNIKQWNYTFLFVTD